jgi:hypothetical protein
MGEQTRLLKYGRVDVTSEHSSIDRDVWEKSVKGNRIKPTSLSGVGILEDNRGQPGMEIRGQALAFMSVEGFLQCLCHVRFYIE